MVWIGSVRKDIVRIGEEPAIVIKVIVISGDRRPYWDLMVTKTCAVVGIIIWLMTIVKIRRPRLFPDCRLNS